MCVVDDPPPQVGFQGFAEWLPVSLVAGVDYGADVLEGELEDHFGQSVFSDMKALGEQVVTCRERNCERNGGNMRKIERDRGGRQIFR